MYRESYRDRLLRKSYLLYFFQLIFLSAFRTREYRQPTSKFVAVCPCLDVLMQDGTQEGNVAYVISHRGACSRGYKRRARERGREQERERESMRVSVSTCLPCPRCQCIFTWS
jgi:hypothetical protein